jgi:hypothetical protein
LEYQHVFHPFGDEGKPRPYNVSVFWFGAIEIPMRFGDPVVGLRRRYSPRKPGGRLPALRCRYVFRFCYQFNAYLTIRNA